MPYYCCANDIFSRCSKVPEWDVKPSGEILSDGHCRRHVENCNKRLTFTQDVRRMVDEAKARLEDWSRHDCLVKLIAIIEKKEKEAGVS